MAEFTEWPKTPRLRRNVIVTEKIDGTNGAIHIEEDGTVTAQSRSRLIYPGKQTDNAGFAAWVDECKEALADILGPGLHFGEWWGQGIQRGYDMDHKVFSLFNTTRWLSDETNLEDENFNPLFPELQVVPVIWEGPFDEAVEYVDTFLQDLSENGSFAAPFYMNPEGIVLFHSDANHSFKVTLKNDEKPKSLVG